MTSLLHSPMGLPICIALLAFVLLMVIVVLGICRVPGFRNRTVLRDYTHEVPEPPARPQQRPPYTKPLPMPETVTARAERID